VTLRLCYDANGLVYDYLAEPPAWSYPPKGAPYCADQDYFWPLVNSCYNPSSGFAFNPAADVGDWVYVGRNFTLEPSKEGGCSLRQAPRSLPAAAGPAALGLALLCRRLRRLPSA
jgi:hypothetical protein